MHDAHLRASHTDTPNTVRGARGRALAPLGLSWLVALSGCFALSTWDGPAQSHQVSDAGGDGPQASPKTLVCSGLVCVLNLPCAAGERRCFSAHELVCTPGGQQSVLAPCASGQACWQGACVSPTCQVELPEAVSAWAVASASQPAKTEGCDLNGDGQPDNRFGVLRDLMLGALNKRNTQGLAGVVLQPRAGVSDQHFLLRTLHAAGTGPTGGLSVQAWWGTPVAPDICPASDPQREHCRDLTLEGLLTSAPTEGSCPLRAQAAVAAPSSEPAFVALAAGVTDVDLPPLALHLPLTDDGGSPMPIRQPRLSARWAQPLSGQTVRLCGVVTRADLVASLALADAGYQKMFGNLNALLAVLDMELVPDVDTDGDDVPDAISLALDLTFVPGWIRQAAQ